MVNKDTPQVSTVCTAPSLGVAGANTSCWRPSPRSLLPTGQGPLEHSSTLRRAPEFASFLTFLLRDKMLAPNLGK